MIPPNIDSIAEVQGPIPVNGGLARRPAALAKEPPLQAQRRPVEVQPGAINWWSLVGAFRRRWFISLFLGITLGAAAGTATWFLVPAPFTAFAELRISSVQNRILFKTSEERASFETWKQTQMKLAKSLFVLNAATRKPSVARLSLIQNQPHPVHWLEEKLQVSSSGTEFIRISLAGELPSELATLLNAVTEAYLAEIVEGEQESRRARLAHLEKVHGEVDELLRAKQRNLRNLTDSLQAGNTTQANQRQQFYLDLAIQMRKELADVHMQLMSTKLNLGSGLTNGEKEAEPSIPDAIVDAQVAQEPEVQKNAARIAALESYIGQLEARFEKSNPKVVEARAQLAAAEKRRDELPLELRGKIKQRLADQVSLQMATTSAESELKQRRQANDLDARKKQLEEELAKVQVREVQNGVLSFELEALGKQIDQSEAISNQISSETERLKVELQSPIGISLYRPAEAPLFRDQKKQIAFSALAGGGVFALIVAGIVWLEFRFKRISMVDEVVQGLSLRIMGSLPLLPRSVKTRKAGQFQARSAYWHNVLTESIDSTRTMLLRDAQANSMSCVMVASAMAAEGKTTLSCHLATSMARTGRRVILIDCDMRRPNVHKVFGGKPNPGICELLKGEVELAAAIQATSTPGLWIIPAGQVCAPVLQKLAQDGLQPILDQLREQFDFVIVDSSPILPVTDSLLVAQHVDGVLFAIRRDVSRAAKVSAACHRMTMLGVPVLGAVVIGLDESSSGSQYGYAYGYGYGYGYGHGYSYGAPIVLDAQSQPTAT